MPPKQSTEQMRDRLPTWIMTPEQSDAGPPAPSQEQMHAAADRAMLHGEVQAAGDVSTHEDLIYATDLGRFTRYLARPLVVIIACGSLALILLAGQMWWADLRQALGWKLPVADAWIRLAMIFLGAYLAFLAWPTWRYRDWTPEGEAEEDAAHEYFRRKRGL